MQRTALTVLCLMTALGAGCAKKPESRMYPFGVCLRTQGPRAMSKECQPLRSQSNLQSCFWLLNWDWRLS